MLMTKMHCPTCQKSFALVDAAPEPGSSKDFFAALMLSAIDDPALGPDETYCPHCGTVVPELCEECD